MEGEKNITVDIFHIRANLPDILQTIQDRG